MLSWIESGFIAPCELICSSFSADESLTSRLDHGPLLHGDLGVPPFLQVSVKLKFVDGEHVANVSMDTVWPLVFHVFTWLCLPPAGMPPPQ